MVSKPSCVAPKFSITVSLFPALQKGNEKTYGGENEIKAPLSYLAGSVLYHQWHWECWAKIILILPWAWTLGVCCGGSFRPAFSLSKITRAPLSKKNSFSNHLFEVGRVRRAKLSVTLINGGIRPPFRMPHMHGIVCCCMHHELWPCVLRYVKFNLYRLDWGMAITPHTCIVSWTNSAPCLLHLWNSTGKNERIACPLDRRPVSMLIPSFALRTEVAIRRKKQEQIGVPPDSNSQVSYYTYTSYLGGPIWPSTNWL